MMNMFTGLIIRKLKVGYFTNLKEVFDVLGNIATRYNWMISDYECNCYPSERIPFGEKFVWLSGSELVDIFNKHEIQFIWGVVTAYEKDIGLEKILEYPLPFADGYEGFWHPEVTMQNPLSIIEIVPWDSTYLLVISKLKDIIESFAKSYPDSIDLAEYNIKGSVDG